MRRGGDIVPGRSLALGATLFLLGLVVVLPLAVVVATAGGMTPERLLHAVASPRALASFRLTFGAALAAALADVVAGTYVAYVLVRHPFRLRPVLDAMVDIPLAMPTAVTGIALATLYGSHGALGSLAARVGWHIAYTPAGIILALTFVGLPFVVRAVQPVLAGLPAELEEAAGILGATQWSRLRRITLPLLSPAILTGFALAFARGLGEYGSVVFISGNLPFRTEIAPLLIITRLEEYDYQGGAAVAAVLLLSSFLLLAGIAGLQRRLSLQKAAT